MPKRPADLVGRYIAHTGFSNLEVKLGEQGDLSMQAAFDHPGRRSVHRGKWRFDGDTLFVEIPYRMEGKSAVDSQMWVPIAWGERLMLADTVELLSGRVGALLQSVGRQMRFGGRTRWFGDEPTDLRLPFRVGASTKMFGKPRTTPLYASLLEGIPSLNLPVPRDH